MKGGSRRGSRSAGESQGAEFREESPIGTNPRLGVFARSQTWPPHRFGPNRLAGAALADGPSDRLSPRNRFPTTLTPLPPPPTLLSPSSSWPTQAAVRPPASSSTGARPSSRRLRSRPRALPSSRPVSSSQIVRPTPKRSLLLPPNILTLCWVLSTAAEDYLDLSKSAEHDNYVQKTLDRQKVRSSPPLPSQLYTLRAVGADLSPPAISFPPGAASCHALEPPPEHPMGFFPGPDG